MKFNKDNYGARMGSGLLGTNTDDNGKSVFPLVATDDIAYNDETRLDEYLEGLNTSIKEQDEKIENQNKKIEEQDEKIAEASSTKERTTVTYCAPWICDALDVSNCSTNAYIKIDSKQCLILNLDSKSDVVFHFYGENTTFKCDGVLIESNAITLEKGEHIITRNKSTVQIESIEVTYYKTISYREYKTVFPWYGTELVCTRQTTLPDVDSVDYPGVYNKHHLDMKDEAQALTVPQTYTFTLDKDCYITSLVYGRSGAGNNIKLQKGDQSCTISISNNLNVLNLYLSAGTWNLSSPYEISVVDAAIREYNVTPQKEEYKHTDSISEINKGFISFSFNGLISKDDEEFQKPDGTPDTGGLVTSTAAIGDSYITVTARVRSLVGFIPGNTTHTVDLQLSKPVKGASDSSGELKYTVDEYGETGERIPYVIFEPGTYTLYMVNDDTTTKNALCGLVFMPLPAVKENSSSVDIANIIKKLDTEYLKLSGGHLTGNVTSEANISAKAFYETEDSVLDNDYGS